MTQEAKIVFTGENKGLLELYEKERQANEKKDEALRRSSQTAREAYKEEQAAQKKLNEEKKRGEQITRSVETAEERYARTMDELRHHLKGGTIDQQTFNRAARDARTELSANTQQTGVLGGAFGRLVPTTLTLAAAFSKAAGEQAKFRDETEETILKMDKLSRAYQIQAGLNNLQSKQARTDILQIARSNAVDENTAFGAATQLVSSGFASPEKSGALDAFLKIVASSNKAGEDPTALVQGSGQFLTAFGMDKNGQNLLNLGIRSRGLFAQTDFQVGDLTAFAQSAGTFAGAGVSLEDTLSANAILREQMAASEAATQGRNVVSSLQTFAADSGRSKVLQKQLGLQAGQLDLVGESLPQALGTLDTAIAALPENERATVLTKLFGRENLRGAQALLGGTAKFKTFAELQRDRAGFVAGVNVAQSGVNAAVNRFNVDKTLKELESEDEASRRRLAEMQLEQMDAENYQASGPAGDFAIGFGNLFRDPLIYTGVADAETFIGPEGTRRINELQQSNFSGKDLERALNRNAQAQEEANRQRRAPQPVRVVGPQAQPPAAALGN